MKPRYISISKYTTTPGPRLIEEGEFSAEWFVEKIGVLDGPIILDLYNTAGFARSSLSELFYRWVKRYGFDWCILNIMVLAENFETWQECMESMIEARDFLLIKKK